LVRPGEQGQTIYRPCVERCRLDAEGAQLPGGAPAQEPPAQLVTDLLVAIDQDRRSAPFRQRDRGGASGGPGAED
jgi:hypothetical protein